MTALSCDYISGKPLINLRSVKKADSAIHSGKFARVYAPLNFTTSRKSSPLKSNHCGAINNFIHINYGTVPIEMITRTV